MSEPIYLDSWWEPSAGAIAWARQRGFVGWLGYFSNGDDGILHGWADATFARIRAAGLQTAAFCSYRAAAAPWKARAAALGIPLILDVERSVDGGDGPAVDPWLSDAGAALYASGNDVTTHHAHGHAGYVLAGYISNSGTPNPIDPGLTFGTVPLPNPARPIGRQFAGGVPTPYGPVDYSHFDPAFFTTTPTGGFLMALTDAQQQTLLDNVQQIHNTLFGGEQDSLTRRIDANVTALQADVAKLPAGTPAPPHNHSIPASTTGESQ